MPAHCVKFVYEVGALGEIGTNLCFGKRGDYDHWNVVVATIVSERTAISALHDVVSYYRVEALFAQRIDSLVARSADFAVTVGFEFFLDDRCEIRIVVND
jgi:hypothetical protein